MRKRITSAKDGLGLSKVLGLRAAAAAEWEVQAKLLMELQEAVKEDGYTHAQVAKRARTSRTRITSILNGNLKHVSTDLLIRILGSLGYRVNLTVKKGKLAA
jgi:predicted XRE-type DNA-binding protein